MNNYEHTIIARQDTTASQIKQIKEKYSEIIQKYKGNIVQTQDWGLINLSYLIKKNKKGNYIHFKIKCEGSLIQELERNEKLDKNLLASMSKCETLYFQMMERFEYWGGITIYEHRVNLYHKQLNFWYNYIT